MTRLAGTALITGGARRIGRAIVEDLAANGFAVAIHSNSSADEASALAADIKKAGGQAAVVVADLTDMSAVAKVVWQAERALGPVSLLVNNASLFEDDSVLDFDWPEWDRHFDIHLKAPVLLAQKFAEALPEATDGLIVNVIDQRVWRLSPRYFSYTLSKSALWTATQTMAQALAPRIRVNAIGPGPTLRNTRQDDSDFRKQVDALLLKQSPDLSEFGATIRYLWQAHSVTGQMIALDGGQHLAWQTPDVAGIVE
ncbi:short-chain dehydrogenase [Mesorhizobium sp. Root552]|jgi:NAD(P)-dependent dehydrogenase (short-subunit alcohol dehydrogenase family)|uniref:SDR family oxidoreductase n=1 Tax=Mesorhizobium sp. Root552 TaxID=1736555 RepID=UPI0006F8A87A|nr:SDR family oxidoreductase [Mesorhizobium sp. Root552]KQZ16684.1 short-chain dehydrogenase [Mesorhizobium sp. Root552]